MNLHEIRRRGLDGLLDDWLPLLGFVFSDRRYHLHPVGAMQLLRNHVCAQAPPDPLLIDVVCRHVITLAKDTNAVSATLQARARRLLNALNIAAHLTSTSPRSYL
jgi:hypothetical protein